MFSEQVIANILGILAVVVFLAIFFYSLIRGPKSIEHALSVGDWVWDDWIKPRPTSDEPDAVLMTFRSDSGEVRKVWLRKPFHESIDGFTDGKVSIRKGRRGRYKIPYKSDIPIEGSP